MYLNYFQTSAHLQVGNHGQTCFDVLGPNGEFSLQVCILNDLRDVVVSFEVELACFIHRIVGKLRHASVTSYKYKKSS